MSSTASYRIRVLPEPHLLDVALSLKGLPPGPVQLAAPTWVPGAYGFMKYARELYDIRATDGAGKPLEVVRDGWSGFTVQGAQGAVEVSYRATGFDHAMGELSGLVDHEYAVLLATRYLHAPAHVGPCTVTYELPRGWKLHHPDGARRLDERTWEYPSYAALLDSPVVAGAFTSLSRDVDGVPFHFVFVDKGYGFEGELERFVGSLAAIAHECGAVFGGFPFAHYTFIFTFDREAHWGLEHANATMIGLSENALIDAEERAHGIRVAAHELFHAWNVCRLRPSPLGKPDFVRGSFPDGLWVSEGFTRYYEFLLCARAGELPPEAFWSNVLNYYRHLEDMPAFGRVSPRDSSLSTFLNHGKYPGSINTTIDYYDAGMLVAFDLDALARTAEPPQALDALFHAFYESHVGKGDGFTHADVVRFFGERVRGADELIRREVERPGGYSVPKMLERLGFEVKSEQVRRAGLVLKKGEGPEIENVLDDGPAARTGLAPGDVVQAVDGMVFGAKGLRWCIAHQERVHLDVLRAHRALRFDIEPEARQRISALVWRGTAAQAERIREWLRRPELKLEAGTELPLSAFDNFHGVQAVL